jgi:hypothetical protein
MKTIHGFKVESQGDPIKPGTPEWLEFNEGIACWNRAAFSSLNTPSMVRACENVVRELEIQRDTGAVVHINTRI